MTLEAPTKGICNCPETESTPQALDPDRAERAWLIGLVGLLMVVGLTGLMGLRV